MSLRPYQIDCINQIREAIKNGHKRVVLQAATGLGKSRIFSEIVKSSVKKGNKVWILAHRLKLITQASSYMHDINFSIVNPIYLLKRNADVQIGTIQSIRRFLKLPAPNLICIDEAHRACSPQYKRIINEYPNAIILGFTATPERTDGRGLGEIFTHMVKAPSIQWAQENGYLCNYELYEIPSEFDAKKIRDEMGKIDEEYQENEINRSLIVGDAVRQYRNICENVPALAFCCSVKASIDTAMAFNDAGYRAISLSANSSEKEREEAFSLFEKRIIKIICSCDLLIEGIDLPCATACIMLRFTDSIIIYLQAIGRVLRPHKDKSKAIILDHVGNSSEKSHGLPCQERNWSLEGRKKKDKKSAPIKQCEKCYQSFPASKKVDCPNLNCPLIMKDSNMKVIEIIEGDLIKVNIDDRIKKQEENKQRKKEVSECKTLEKLQELGRKRGYKPNWALHVFNARNNKF